MEILKTQFNPVDDELDGDRGEHEPHEPGGLVLRQAGGRLLADPAEQRLQPSAQVPARLVTEVLPGGAGLVPDVLPGDSVGVVGGQSVVVPAEGFDAGAATGGPISGCESVSTWARKSSGVISSKNPA